MVKSIVYTVCAILLCCGFFIFSNAYNQRQFKDMQGALCMLYDKTEEKTATQEDAYAVKKLWEEKKRKLHVFVPHNDISYIDYWLNEACAMLYKQRYDEALGNIEVLIEITKNLPDAYSLKIENLF